MFKKLFAVFIFCFLLIGDVSAYHRNESMNQKVDIWYNYFRVGKNLSDFFTLVNANPTKKYEAVFSQEVVTLTANREWPSNVVEISSDRGGGVTGNYTLTHTGQLLDIPKGSRFYGSGVTVTGNVSNDKIFSSWFDVVSGDGLDDSTGLQKLLDFADHAVIDGDYDISTQIDKTSGTTFKMTFDIGGKISLLSNFAPTGDLQTGSAVFLNNIPNVEVYNFQYDGNRASLGYTENIVHAALYILNATDNVKVKGGFLENSPGSGVRVKLSKNVNIEELVITNNMFHPINYDSCEKVYVKRNNIYGIGNQGTNVNIGGIGILGATCDYVWIEGNYIKNMSDTGTKTQESSEVYYLNNKVYDSGKDGIKVQSEGVGGVNAHLIGNTVDSIYYWRDDGSFLIGAIDFDNVILKDNILKGGSKATGTEDAIRITTGSQNNTNVTIEGNQAYGVVSAFMTINDVTGNLTVVDNQGDRPINLDDIFGDVKFNDNIVRFATYSTTEDNVQFISDARTIDFSNNTLEGGLRGLLLQPNSVDGNAIKINENIIRGTAEDGIRLANFSGVTSNIVSLSIMDNDFYDICRNNTATRAAIRFSNDKVNLSHLKIKDNNGYSLQIPGDRLIALQGSGTKIGLASFSENYFNGVVESVFDTGRIEQFASGGRTGATPTVGSYENGDIVMNSAPSGTEPIGWVCSTSGTFGTLTGVTGNITSGTVELTVNDASDLNLYQYINIAGVTGTKKIIKVDGTTITIDSSADATVSGASVSYQTPVFTNFGQLY